MPHILVTDGEHRAALAVVRSLGAAGHRVHVCSPRRHCLAGASRHAERQHAVPDPLASPEAFAEAVTGLAATHGVDLVIPVGDAAMLALLERRQHAGVPRVAGPSLEAYRAVSDKAAVAAAAREIGIDVPRQRVVQTPAEAREVEPESLTYPVVVKPARTVAHAAPPTVDARPAATVAGGTAGAGAAGAAVGASDAAGTHAETAAVRPAADAHAAADAHPAERARMKHAVSYAEDAEALRRRLQEAPESAFPLLLQERIEGIGTGIFLLIHSGRVLARFAHRRLREKPPSGGVSVYREAIPPDERLVERSYCLLQRFGWEGVAMIEYKRQSATGREYLMEVNGRFWGSLQLAVDAGVDFPALLVSSELEDRPAPVLDYRVGVRSRWWWGDVDHLLSRLRHSPEALALPPGAPGRARAVAAFLRPPRRVDRSEVLRLSDPLPFVRETIDWLGGR